MKIKCSDIIADPADNKSRNEANTLNPQDCVGLAQTIDRVGQLAPVLVKPEGDKYRLAAGFRRYTAIAIVLGGDEIWAEEIPAEATQEEVNAIENLHQKPRSFWEECCMLRAMYPHDIEMKQIERDIGMSKQWVNVRWKAWYLPAEVKSQIEAGLLTFSDVQTLVQKGVDAEAAAAKLIAGKAAGQTSATMRTKVLEHRTNVRGKRAIQQVMTKCLKKEKMQAVQALRFACGEIEEQTLLNWLDSH